MLLEQRERCQKLQSWDFFKKSKGQHLKVWFEEVGKIFHLEQEEKSHLGRTGTRGNGGSGEG